MVQKIINNQDKYMKKCETNQVPEPCEPGTFSDKEGLENPSQCESCPPGFYCDVQNLTAPVSLIDSKK